MNAIGGQEMLAPVLTPAELWQKSGRYDLGVVFKLQDRNGRQYVLPMSHEETFAFHAAELQSYKQLPQIWYHFGTKERRAEAARRPAPGPRIHHEGRLLVRSRRGWAGRELPQARRGVRPRLRALRARVLRGGSRVRRDGGQGQQRLPGARRG